MTDYDSEIKIDRPHPPGGIHADLITKFPFGGVDKMRLGPEGEIKTEEVFVKGGKINIER